MYVPPLGWRRISARTTESVSWTDYIAHPRGARTLTALDREKRLGHRNSDLRRLETDHRAVAPDYLVLREHARMGGRWHGGIDHRIHGRR